MNSFLANSYQVNLLTCQKFSFRHKKPEVCTACVFDLRMVALLTKIQGQPC